MSSFPARRRRARAFGALLLACVPAGCAVFTTAYATPGPHPSTRPVPVRDTDLFDWKGVVHCHSFLSHDSKGTIATIAAAAENAQDDFVVMTDHQTEVSISEGQRGFVGNTLFLVGAEVRSPQGTLLCFPLTKPLRHFQHPALLAKEAAGQGGLAFVCHAESWRIPFAVPGMTGAEIVNLHAGALTVGKPGTLGTALFLPLRMLMRRICVRDDKVFTEWDQALAQQHPFTPIGGDDAHANIRVFGPLGGTVANYQEVFLTLSTHVLAAKLDQDSLVEAFREGRTYVSFDAFGEGAGFDFRAVDADGVHLGGSTVEHGDALSLRVFTPDDGSIRLLRDGVEVAHRDGRGLMVHAPEPGIYRVEVYKAGGNPWLFSSSIRVR